MRRALVLGSGPDVFAEADAALAMFTPDLVIVVKDLAILWPPRHADLWATLHPEKVPEAIRRGAPADLPIVCQVADEVAPDYLAKITPHAQLSFRWTRKQACGSSGLFGVKVALELGRCDQVVIAGMPMTQAPHVPGGLSHVRYAGKPWPHVKAFRKAWEAALPFYAPQTRSMSGWTRELLGTPTAEWLRA